ncbi:MAG: polyprenyl synthetase family protein [Candidatus Bathyarchaeaceae archaeon]
MSRLSSQLDETAEKVNGLLKEVVSLEREPTLLYKAARYIIDAGGKRLRPYLVLKSCKLVGGREEDALPTAAALELLHTFTLIHDDIIDEDEKRRGLLTVHVQWGVPTAIVAGDFLFAKVYETITKYTDPRHVPSKRILQVIRGISEATITICEGQTLDMTFERRETVSEDEYFRMIRAKTAALFEVSARCGGILGGGDKSQVKNLGRFGYYAGLAFQLIDDVLGLTADEKVLGKPVGSDIREGKRTLIIVHALKHASETQRKKILGTLGDRSASSERIRETISLVGSLGSISYAEEKAKEYIKKSKDALTAFPPTEDREDLINLADIIIARKY